MNQRLQRFSLLFILVFTMSIIIQPMTPQGKVHADPVCNSIDDCKRLILAANTRIEELLRPGPTLGPIARDADGSISVMSHVQAERYCAPLGGLPTIRQLFLALNPLGVSETPRPGFYLIHSQEGDFYYALSVARYEGGGNGYWSSTLDPDRPEYAFDASCTRDGCGVSAVYRTSNTSWFKNLVRCVARR